MSCRVPTSARDPVALGFAPYGLSKVRGGLLFSGWDPDHGHELWRSDGTPQNTGLAQDIAVIPGFSDSRPQKFIEMGTRTFFLADDGVAGIEPWVARTAILLNQPERAIQDLADEVKGLGLEKGLRASLLAKLDAAARALSEDRLADARTALEVFSNHVNVLTPRWISEAAAAGLREFAEETAGLLEDAP